MMEKGKLENDHDFVFWKNIVLITFFFLVTPITLVVGLFSLFSLKSFSISKNFLVKNVDSTALLPESGIRVFASLPTEFPYISENIISSDARPEIIKKYLKFYNSPLLPYSSLIVEVADRYSLDFRLITAIAQQESNLCKVIPPDSYNCWGWGIHSRGSLGFSSFEEGIETVSSGLRNEYLNKGYTTVEQIMSKYTPQSNGSWAHGVNQFLQEME